MTAPKKRTKLFTGRPAQIRYLALVLVSMIVPLIFVGGCLYYLIFTLVADQLGIPESIAVNLFPVVGKINLLLLIGIPVILAAMVWWALFLSHRFIGPFERLERELDRMAKSADYSRRITLRKKDDLKPIADKINALLDAIQRKAR